MAEKAAKLKAVKEMSFFGVKNKIKIQYEIKIVSA